MAILLPLAYFQSNTYKGIFVNVQKILGMNPNQNSPFTGKSSFLANKAFLIGIADYNSPELRLHTSINDVNAVASLLRDEHNFSVETFLNPTAAGLRVAFQKTPVAKILQG